MVTGTATGAASASQLNPATTGPGPAEFGVASESVVALGVTTYLVGLAVGSLVVAPMSELYGRRPVYLLCQIGFAVMIVPCALAKSLTEVIVFRFVG